MRRIVLALGLTLWVLLAHAQKDPYRIGVYYFPGWANHQSGAQFPLPWEKIKPFPEREPMLGWYKEGSDDVARQHIDWMADYGINFVVYDWYWSRGNTSYLEHALASYLRAPNRNRIGFSLLWANHNQVPASRDNFDQMIRHWIRYYFNRKEYLKVEGKPVVFIFDAESLRNDAAKLGLSTKDLLDSSQEIARQNGLPGIYFVAGAPAVSPMIDGYASASGYSALSAYNYHGGLQSPIMSRSFPELDAAYQEHWNRFGRKSDLPVILPMTSGWDKRPWGGSRDPLHDQSRGTPEQFEAHLLAARRVLDSGLTGSLKMGVLCCWNEFGEGSYVEPTKKEGFGFLEKIRKIFGVQ